MVLVHSGSWLHLQRCSSQHTVSSLRARSHDSLVHHGVPSTKDSLYLIVGAQPNFVSLHWAQLEGLGKSWVNAMTNLVISWERKKSPIFPFRIPVRNEWNNGKSTILQTMGSRLGSADTRLVPSGMLLELSGLLFWGLENKGVSWIGKWIPNKAVRETHLGAW